MTVCSTASDPDLDKRKTRTPSGNASAATLQTKEANSIRRCRSAAISHPLAHRPRTREALRTKQQNSEDKPEHEIIAEWAQARRQPPLPQLASLTPPKTTQLRHSKTPHAPPYRAEAALA